METVISCMAMIQETPESWNIDLGRFMLVFLLFWVLGMDDNHIPTFWLLL